MIIQWKSSQALFANDYIKITLPETIHNGSLTISYSISTAYSKEITNNQNSLAYLGSNTYYLPVSANLSSSTWYELRLNVDKSLTVLYGLVQLSVVSSLGSSPIMHAWNDGFQYFHLEQNNIPTLSTFILSINNSVSTMAGSRYPILF